MMVFVTGTTGFIGLELCSKMLQRGWVVKGALRKESARGILPLGVEGVNLGSIEDGNFRPRDFEGVDAVIHLAGRTHVLNDKSDDQLTAFRKVNVLGTESLARAAAKAGVRRFIFVSSVKVNGNGAARPYTENDPPAPEDAYGISKYEAEESLSSISMETGIEIVILRPPLVYGPGVKANFKDFIRMVSSGLPIPLKSIDNQRSFIYLDNLCDAIICCVTHPFAAGKTFLVSDGQDISTPDLIRMISSAMNKKPFLFSLHVNILKGLCKIAGKSEELGKITGSLFVDSSKIRDLLGWNPPFTLEEGIKETVKQYNR